MSKTTLMVVGIVLVLMGIAGLVSGWTWATEPAWHAWVKILVGAISIGVSYSDNKA